MQFLPNRHVLRCGVVALTSLLSIAFTTGVALAGAAGDIVVVATHGEVSSTLAGVTTPLYANAVLQLPATIRTGPDGAIELRQGKTTLAAAGDTELEIPASAAEEGLIERVVQIGGNAFYNVAKRERTRLRVETPYLVAVIKGTQFNVAAQADSTTIALFEGRLEVRAPDGSDVIDLHAGEIAIRHRGDVSIQVLNMRTAAVHDERRAGGTAGVTSVNESAVASSDSGNGTGSGATGEAATHTDSGPEKSAGAVAALDLSDVSTGASVNVVSNSVQVGAGLSADLGAANVGTDVSLDVGSGNVAVDAGASLSAGSVGADIGAGASISGTSVDVGADLSAGLGSVAADTSAGASIDLGSGSVSVDAGTSIDTGGAGVGVDVSAGASVADGANVVADVGADIGGVAADASLDLGLGTGTDTATATDAGVTPVLDVSVGNGGASTDLNVGNVLGIGLDAGIGTTETDTGNDDSSGGGGGLLNGLLGRP